MLRQAAHMRLAVHHKRPKRCSCSMSRNRQACSDGWDGGQRPARKLRHSGSLQQRCSSITNNYAQQIPFGRRRWRCGSAVRTSNMLQRWWLHGQWVSKDTSSQASVQIASFTSREEASFCFQPSMPAKASKSLHAASAWPPNNCGCLVVPVPCSPAHQHYQGDASTDIASELWFVMQHQP